MFTKLRFRNFAVKISYHDRTDLQILRKSDRTAEGAD